MTSCVLFAYIYTNTLSIFFSFFLSGLFLFLTVASLGSVAISLKCQWKNNQKHKDLNKKEGPEMLI